MIQNLLHTPSRTTETNASGIIKDGAGKDSGKEKEGLFKQLFESIQKNDEKGEISNKPEGEIKKEEAKSAESEKIESATSGSEKNDGSQNITAKSEEREKSNVSAKNDQTVSTNHADDGTVKQSAADTKIGEQKESLSSKEETILKTGSKNQTEQQDNRAGSESAESKPANTEGQNSEGENRITAPSGTPAQQVEHVSKEAAPESGEQDNSRPSEHSNNQTNSAAGNDQGSGKSEAVTMAGSLKTQNTGETISTEAASAESGKSEAATMASSLRAQSQNSTNSTEAASAESGKSGTENMDKTPQSESRELTTSTETGSAEISSPSESPKIAFEAMSASSQERSGQMKTQPGSEKQASNASQARPNPDPVSVTQGVEGAKPEANTMSAPEQAANMPSELGTVSESAKPVPGENMLTENESGNRIDTPLRDTGNIIARMVMGQLPGGGVAAGPNAQTPQSAEFTRNAQAFVTQNVPATERSGDPETTMIRKELLNGNMNKPEVFGISSDIKKVFNQKNKSQDERGRLDVDKLSMRADAGKRVPVLDMENLQFGSNGHQAMKWDWSAGSQSSSDKAEDSFTFKKFTHEFTASKEVESTDQKNTNYTSLASVTISNISVKRNVLPGLSQAVLTPGSGKSTPESWNKHSFVLEDGSKIQLSSRKLDGVIQLKIGSTTPELNRLLQQHQNEIIEHLKKESELDVDLQFDTPQEESGFESFEERKNSSQQSQMQHATESNVASAGSREYETSRKVRTFGYNNMEWTA